MPTSIYPAALSTSSYNWVQLSSVTPTAVSTISFTSLTAYKYYKIVSNKLSTTTGATIIMTLNNDSTTTYSYLYLLYDGTKMANGSATNSNGIFIGLAGTGNASGYSGVVTINSDLTKEITYTAYGQNSRFGGSANWFDASQINRIDLTANGDTFNASGTIKIFGSN